MAKSDQSYAGYETTTIHSCEMFNFNIALEGISAYNLIENA